MGKNRDRLSIIAAILNAANSGESKTRIMFTANLSFSMLEKYLDIAIEADFLKLDDCKYLVTERGREFLKQYKRFHERYDRAQKILDDLGSEREKLARLCQGSELENSAASIMDTE